MINKCVISLLNASSVSLMEAQVDRSVICFTNDLRNRRQQQHDSPDVAPSGRNMQSDGGWLIIIVISYMGKFINLCSSTQPSFF